MKNKILEWTKTELKEKIDELDLENIEEIEEDVSKGFRFLETLGPFISTQKERKEEINKEEPKTEEIIVEEPQVLLCKEQPSDTPQEEKERTYIFKRSVRGGFLEEIDAYVPERIVRDLSLEEGDEIYATLLSAESGRPDRYEYEVAKHHYKGEPKGRVQIDFAIVKYSPDINRYVVEKDAFGNELVHPEEKDFILTEDDANYLGLQDGDVIDIAYKDVEPSYIRAIWKHAIDVQPVTKNPVKVEKKQDSKYGKKFEPTLEGYTIAILGFEPGKSKLEEEINARGGEMVFASGGESVEFIKNQVSNADVLLIFLRHTSHKASNAAIEAAKEYGVLYDNTKHTGRTSAIFKLEDMIRRKKKITQ